MGRNNTVSVSAVEITCEPSRHSAMKHLLGIFLFLLVSPTSFAQDWGIINVSVCNTRALAEYGSEQESQALLGMPVRVLDKSHEWLKVMTPDDYVAWTLAGSVQRVSREELTAWNTSPQLVITALYGTVYSGRSEKSQPVGDVVGGDRLRLLERRGKYYHVAYPDGREGYVHRNMGMPLEAWRQSVGHDAASILRTAYSMVGVPYMWGGTSSKGVDCSGLIRTTLYMHDIIIPRNASQQARKGQRIEIASDFSNLVPGDLLFFGRKADATHDERVSHVAFYVGDMKFIHSLGFVREGSFRPTDANYDAYDLGRLLFAARFLPYINQQEGMFTTGQHDYYK